MFLSTLIGSLVSPYGETRFWSFKKVSNKKNKDTRIEEPVDGVNTSFKLPRCSVLTFFVREEAYEAGKNVFVGACDHATIVAFSPVLLQLSGSNSEQVLKSNSLKLCRVMPLRQEAMMSSSTTCAPPSSTLSSVRTQPGDTPRSATLPDEHRRVHSSANSSRMPLCIKTRSSSSAKQSRLLREGSSWTQDLPQNRWNEYKDTRN